MQVLEHENTTRPSLARRAMAAGTVGVGTLVLAGPAHATTPPAGPDYDASVQAAKDQGVAILTDNVLLLFALPVLWVGYKVTRKVIGKIG